MIKMLIIIGIFLLIISTGLIIKDWDKDDDVRLLSEDDFKEIQQPSGVTRGTVPTKEEFESISKAPRGSRDDDIKYYGPVPEGYDQEYFYSTGKMRLLNNG